MKKLFALVVLSLVAAGVFATPNQGTGAWLYSVWVQATAEESTLNKLVANARFAGFVEGVALMSFIEMNYISMPEGVSTGDLTKAVGAYLEAHPERLDHLAHTLVIYALAEKYPGTSKEWWKFIAAEDLHFEGEDN